MADYVVAQAAVLIVPTTEGFKKKLEAELRKIQAQSGPIKIEATLDSNKAVAQFEATKAWMERQDITLQAKVDTRALTEIRHKYEDLQREMEKGLLLNLKIVGMSLIPQLVQGLAAVNASMVQLSQTAVLLPGVLSGALSSFGALATGLSGVKDAFKEYGDAQKNAAQEGLKARNSAKNVQNAYRDLGRSFKDAKRNLEDLNAELRGAPLDEADAIIALAEARAEAADKAQKSGLQQQKDALAVAKAENELVNVRLRNSRLIQDAAEANAKGVAGADAVVEATERLSKAQDELATQTTKATDSLKELSPNAQAFVRALTGMQSQWTAFRNSTQDRLFAGLDTEITRLAQVSLPTLQKGFGAIADSLNGNVKAAFDELGSATNQNFLDKILGDTAAAQANLSGIFDPLIDSFLRLSAVGTGLLPRLVDGLVDLTDRFNNFVVGAEADGSLEKWINQGIDEFKALGNSIINIGSMLNSLNEAFVGSGGRTFLEVLEDGTEKLAKFLESAAGQQQLQDFFRDAREEFQRWGPLLDQLPGLFSNLAAAGQQWANLLLPFLTEVGTMLAQHPNLVKAVFAAYVGWKTIVPVVKGVSTAVEGLTAATQFINQRVFNNEVGMVGRYAAGMTNLKNKIGTVTEAIMSGTGLLAGATALASYMGYQLVNAHDEASAAAQRQKSDLDALTTSLDNVTGASTRATNAMIGKSVLEGNNAATNVNMGNLSEYIKNGTPEQFAQSIASGNLDAALAMVPGAATGRDVEQTEWWKTSGTSLEKAGLNSGMVADALNGEPKAKAKFEEWQLAQMRLNAPIGFGNASKAMLQGLENAGLQTPVNDLLDLQKQLPSSIQKPTALRQEVYAAIGDVQTGKQDIQQQNQFFGRYQLKPDSPFSALGVIDQPQVNDSGGGLTVRSAPAPNSPEADRFRQDGVTFEHNGNGGFNVRLSLDAVNKYFQKMASGGLISGPGGPRSDSILTALSNGEYVVNASATRKHLPLLESINGGGVPGFAGGGLLGDAFGAPKQPDPKAPAGPISDWLFQLPAPAKPTSLMGTAGSASFNSDPTSGGLGDLLGANDSMNTSPVAPVQAPGRNSDPITGSPLASVFSPNPILNAASSGPAPKPAPAPPKPVSGGAARSPVAPTTTVHSGTKPSAGPGNAIPHTVLGSPGRPGPYPTPNLPAAFSAPTSLTAVSPDALNAYNGLPVGSAINYGEGGFPDWVYQVGNEFGMVASTYAGHQEGGGTNKGIDWAPKGVSWNTPEGAEMMTKYAKYLASLGIMEQVIYKNPFTGETVGVFNGKPVGPGTDVPDYYRDDWDGHQDHIHTRMSKAIPSPSQLQQLGLLGGSPSNMPMAMTPTGVMLPQVSYGTGSGGGSAAGGSLGGIRMPTPEEYAKYVSDSWMSTMQNLVQNAGQIAVGFLGSFFGLDLSKITGLANSVMGGIDLPGMSGGNRGGSGGDAASQLGALPEVDAIMSAAQQLPPEYQQSFIDAASQNPAQAGSILQQIMAMAQGGTANVQYDPSKGAEQWRPVVRKILAEVGPSYGITNLKAWEDDIIGQINLESRGNPNVNNLNDSDGKGGTQQVFGLGQFHPQTFAAHNRSGGDISDPVAQIYAMIDYLASPKYGVIPDGGVNWKGVGWRNGKGYAMGGKISGPGGRRSDSIIARVSNGEYVVRAPMAQKHMGLLEAINSNKLPGFAEGGIVNPMFPQAPLPPPPPPPSTPPPPPAPAPPPPNGPQTDAAAGMPTAPTPVTDNAGPGDAESTALKDVGAALGGLGGTIGGVADGAQAPAGGNPEGDPRAVMGAAPQNLDHNKPAVSQGIQSAASAIGSAVSMAMSAAAAGGTMGMGGGAGAAAAGPVQSLIEAGGTAVVGAVNILSSLGVGTVTPSTSTAGAYGAPLTPQGMGQQPYQGPSVVNNWNGGVHTSNNEEFYKLQQRRELQNAAPFLPQR